MWDFVTRKMGTHFEVFRYKTKNDITRLKFLKGYFALRTDGGRDKDQLGDYYNNPH